MQPTRAAAGQPSSPRTPDPLAGDPGSATHANPDARLAQYKVIRRNGAVVAFEPSKIGIAVTKAFLAVNGGQSAASSLMRELTAQLVGNVVNKLMKRKPEGGAIHIEEIQDQVELELMRGGEHEVARAYVLYRERRSQERAQEKALRESKAEAATAVTVVENGQSHLLDLDRLTAHMTQTVAAGPAPSLTYEHFIEELRDRDVPGPVVSPRRFTEALHIDLQTLAEQAGVHRNTIARAPSSTTVQRFLRDALRVIKAATDVTGGDVAGALFWYRNQPLAPFGYKTAEQLVGIGRTEDLLKYIASLTAGAAG